MRKVVYTCLTGNYDDLKEPLVYNPDWTHICYIDNHKMILKSRIGPYKILSVHNDLNLDSVKLARRYKILALGVADFDIIVWHDANMRINCNLDELVEKYLGNSDLALATHPERDCLFDEGVACVKLEKDSKTIVLKQLLDYENFDMPKNYGLYATGVLLRKKFDGLTIEFYNRWWQQVREYSRRDQISFPYCLRNFGSRMNINNFSFSDMLRWFPKTKHNPNEFGGKY